MIRCLKSHTILLRSVICIYICRLLGGVVVVVQSVPITTVNSNSAHAEVYSTQHYVIKFVSDLRKVGGFLQVLQFPPPTKLTAMI